MRANFLLPMSRWSVACVLAAVAAMASAPLATASDPRSVLLAQAPIEPPGIDGGAEAEAPAVPPRPVDRRRDLDFLFQALKAAPDADSARLVETRIMAVWQASGSDTADLLMTRVRQAQNAKELDLGIELLDAVVELRPDYAEGWNRRATLHFLKKDFGAALDDLQQVLAREPRHFGAMVGVGMILQEVGEEKLALDILRRALALHPHLPRVEEMVQTLAEKVEGRAI